MDYLTFAFRVLLAEVLFVSALGKVFTPQAFAATVEKFRLLPRTAVRPFSYLLPWVEGAAAALLLSGEVPRVAAGFTLGLLLTFAVAVASALARGINTNCDCFGLLYRERLRRSTLLRDAALAGMAIVVLAAGRGRFSLQHRNGDAELLVWFVMASAYAVPAYLFWMLARHRLFTRYRGRSMGGMPANGQEGSNA